MSNVEELKNEDLENVNGGADMLISKENNNITIFTQLGKYSINRLFAETEYIILELGGTSGLKACGLIRTTLNEYKSKITKCIIDIDAFVPTYYVDDTPYTQNQIDQGILNN